MTLWSGTVRALISPLPSFHPSSPYIQGTLSLSLYLSISRSLSPSLSRSLSVYLSLFSPSISLNRRPRAHKWLSFNRQAVVSGTAGRDREVTGSKVSKGRNLRSTFFFSASLISNLLKRDQLLSTHRSPSTGNRAPLQTS